VLTHSVVCILTFLWVSVPGDLELPCIYTFVSDKYLPEKAKNRLKEEGATFNGDTEQCPNESNNFTSTITVPMQVLAISSQAPAAVRASQISTAIPWSSQTTATVTSSQVSTTVSNSQVSTTVPSQVSATAFRQVSTVVVSHGNKVSTSVVVVSKNQINVRSYINTEHSYAAPKPLLLDNGIAMSDDTNIWVKVKEYFFD